MCREHSFLRLFRYQVLTVQQRYSHLIKNQSFSNSSIKRFSFLLYFKWKDKIIQTWKSIFIKIRNPRIKITQINEYYGFMKIMRNLFQGLVRQKYINLKKFIAQIVSHCFFSEFGIRIYFQSFIEKIRSLWPFIKGSLFHNLKVFLSDPGI